MIMMIVMVTVILLSAGNPHRDSHGKPQAGFSARKHRHHFTSWRGSGITCTHFYPNLQTVASVVPDAFCGAPCQPADDQVWGSLGVHVRGSNGGPGAPGSQLCQQHPSPHSLLFCPNWAWIWPDVHSFNRILCPIFLQKQVNPDHLMGTTYTALQCRSLAIGICLCGIGCGTFAIAPISNMILEKYGWRTVMRQEE